MRPPLIAISAVALTTAAANASIVKTNDNTTWTNGLMTTYAGETFYVDTLHNAVVNGGGSSVTGGHGWGAYTLTSTTTTSTFSLTGSGAGTSIVATPSPSSNDNYINFNFASTGNATAGLYGIGIYFEVTNIAADAPAPNVTAFFSSDSNAWTTPFTVSPGANFIGFYSTNNQWLQNLSLAFGNVGGTGAIITVTALELGLVPAPGAIALVGVAGLVGSRRRRA